MNTVVELKARLQVGVQIKQIWNSREGDMNRVYTITKVQKREIALTRPDLPGELYWLDIPKRRDIIFTQTGWIRLHDNRKTAEYVWIDAVPAGEEK